MQQRLPGRTDRKPYFKRTYPRHVASSGTWSEPTQSPPEAASSSTSQKSESSQSGASRPGYSRYGGRTSSSIPPAMADALAAKTQ